MEGFSFQKWKYLPPYIPHCRARSQYPPYSFSCLVYQGKQAESQVRSWLLSKDSVSPSHERGLQAKESPNPLSWLGTAIVGPRLGSGPGQWSSDRQFLPPRPPWLLPSIDQAQFHWSSTLSQLSWTLPGNAPLSVLSKCVWLGTYPGTLLQRSRRCSLQAWQWWAMRQKTTFLKKNELFYLIILRAFFKFGLYTLGKDCHFQLPVPWAASYLEAPSKDRVLL